MTNGATFSEKYDNFEIKNDKKGVYYLFNVLHMSIGFFLVYTAFSGIQNLSTSLLTDELGKVSPAVLYVVFTVNCLLGPSLVAKLGVKLCLTLGFCTICFFGFAYLVALCEPDMTTLRWTMVLISASLVGFAASPIWTAQGSYMTANAKELSAKWVPGYNKDSEEIPMMGTANGVFWMCLQLTQVSGNILPSVMTNAGASNKMVFVVYVVVAFVGVLVTAFLRPVHVEQCTPGVKKEVLGMVSMWTDARLLLLIPMIMYNGLECGWIWGDFTANFVKVSLGEHNVGYVMTIFGISDAFFSFGFGRLSDSVGRWPILLCGCLAQLAVAAIVVLTPEISQNSNEWGLMVLIAALWAVGDAALNTQLNSMISETFGKNAEAGFANFKLWQSMMVCVSFLFPLFGMTYKTRSGIYGGVCIVGLLCLLVLSQVNKRRQARDVEAGTSSGGLLCTNATSLQVPPQS